MSRRPTRTEHRRLLLARRIGTLDALEHRSLVSESLGILTSGIGIQAAAQFGRPTAEGAGQAPRGWRKSTVATAEAATARVSPPRVPAPASNGPAASSSPDTSSPDIEVEGTLARAAASLPPGTPSRPIEAGPRPNPITLAQPSARVNPPQGGGAGGTSHGGSGAVAAGATASRATPSAAPDPIDPSAAGIVAPASPSTSSPTTAGPSASNVSPFSSSDLQAAPRVTPGGVARLGATAPISAAPTATSTTASGTPLATSPTAPGPIQSPIVVLPATPTPLAVGGFLDQTIVPGGLAGPGVSYIVTPQPLPANMTFDRGTGELTFAPAPGQAGTYQFTVTAGDGTNSVAQAVEVDVAQPVLASTEVSGRVVDEAGIPLANYPVSVAGVSTATDATGAFVLADVPNTPAPLSAGGAAAAADVRQPLTAPVVQLLGHGIYANSDNVIASPLILPRIGWSLVSVFAPAAPNAPVDVTNPAMPGFAIQAPAGSASGQGTVRLAQLPASVSAQHLPERVGGGLLLCEVTGVDLGLPVMPTLPNSAGLRPGAIMDLLVMNMTTGGHDVAGQMVVSDDGRTMTSADPVTLSHLALAPAVAAAAAASPAGSVRPFDAPDYSLCLQVAPSPPSGLPDTGCAGCQPTGDDTIATGDFPNTGIPRLLSTTQEGLASDVGLVTGEYFQDHQAVTYLSQGSARGVDLQYSSAQARPLPVAQYQFTTQTAGASSSITSVTAQVSLAGVTQGAATTYPTPSGLVDGSTYNIPLQVDGTGLATGAYPYTMTVTENFGTGMGAPAITTINQGYVNVVNNAVDAMGAGWSVGGLQRVSQASAGQPALVTAGRQGTERFDNVYSSGQPYWSDLAIGPGISGPQVLANDGTGHLGAGTLASSGAVAVASAAGDLNGDGRPDLAMAGGSSVAIQLDNGSGGFTAGSTLTLPAGATARAIVAGNFTGHSGGVLDLAVLSTGSGSGYSVSVFTGNGSGAFTGPTTTSAGNGALGSGPASSMVAGDFNGDGKSDLAFTTGDGLLDVMTATSGGSLSSATGVTLPSTTKATGVTTLDYTGDGKVDLVAEVTDYNRLELGTYPFVDLVLLAGNGSGGFAAPVSYQTPGQPDGATVGLVAGSFDGPSYGLEVAVPVTNGLSIFVDVVPLSTSGVWGRGVLLTAGPYAAASSTLAGSIVAADLDGSGKPSIALSDTSANIRLFLADPGSNQLLPPRTLTLAPGSGYYGAGPLAVAAFAGHAATPSFSGPTSDPSTLVHNAGGTWTRSYPDGTVLQFDSSGRETSEADRNGNATSYAYVPTGLAAGSLKTITDPVGLVTTLAYDANGHLSTLTDPAGRVTTVAVDSNGNTTQIKDPDGATVTYGYAAPSNHEITTETNPDGHLATAHYDSFGLLSSEDLFDGTSATRVAPAQAQGLLAPGGSGPLSSAFQGAITDPDGRMTTLGFNWMSHPTSQADATNALVTSTYGDRGFPASQTDAMNRTTSYTYDASGNLTSITRPAPGYSVGAFANAPTTETIAYTDPYGVPTTITDFDGHITTFALDSRGNVLRRTDTDNLHEDWTYNAAGQVLTDSSRAGNTTTYAYDARGRLTTISYPGPGSPRALIGYDPAGDVTSTNDELAHTTTFTYDPAGRVLSSQDPVQAAAGKAVTFAYDPDGKLLGTTDALGHATTFSYSPRDELAGMTDAAHQGTTFHYAYGYDADGNLTSSTDPLGHQTTYSYDNANRPNGSTDPLGHSTSIVYDYDGEQTYSLDLDGHRTNWTYDNLGRVTSRMDGAHYAGSGMVGETTYFADDPQGNTITVTDPLGHVTTYAYDGLDRLVGVTDALVHTTGYGHDADGNRATVTDPLGHTTSSVYDARDRLASQTAPSGGGTTTYTYDLAGRLTGVTDPDSNLTAYGYDNANRETTETDPRGKVTTFAYDLSGNLTRKTDRLGRITSYAYDADNREVVEQWIPVGGGAATYAMTLTYDAAGRETQVQDNFSKYAYGYDNANRLTSVDDAGTAGLPQVTLTYGLDNVGNRTSLADTKGGVVSYTYDLRDLLTTITQSGTGVSPERVDMAYDSAARMTTLTRYSDTAGSSPVMVSAYAYDNANRLTTLTHQTPGGAVVSSYGYTLDAADRLTQEARTWNGGASTDTVTYTYTNNSQLTAATHTNASFANESFGYDANGNRNTTGYSTGTGNRTSTDGTYNYGYDDEGNLTSKTTITTGEQVTYAWDYRNRLVGVVDKTSGGVTLMQGTYTYDALDRRIGTQEAVAPPVPDYGFELPGATPGTYIYHPTSGTPWTYSGSPGSGSGVTANNSGFTSSNPNAPQGNQVAFIQNTGTISQSISGWAAGTYSISFQAAQRGNYSAGTEDFKVLVDGTAVGTFTPSGTSYLTYTTSTFAVTAGAHTLTFQGLDTAGVANSVFLDAVAISVPPTPTTTWTLYDGQTPLLDFDGTGAVTARYLSVPGAIDAVLARQSASGVAWYLDDRLGTVRDLVNNAGSVIDHVDYGAFGNVTGETAPTAGDRFKFAGMEMGTTTGEFYDRRRYYDAALGHFTGLDPAGFAAGDVNLYRYVGSNPTNGIDPSGLADMPSTPPTKIGPSVTAPWVKPYAPNTGWTPAAGGWRSPDGVTWHWDGKHWDAKPPGGGAKVRIDINGGCYQHSPGTKGPRRSRGGGGKGGGRGGRGGGIGGILMLALPWMLGAAGGGDDFDNTIDDSIPQDLTLIPDEEGGDPVVCTMTTSNGATVEVTIYAPPPPPPPPPPTPPPPGPPPPPPSPPPFLFHP